MIILEKATQQFSKIFHYMIENQSRQSTSSLIIHCTAGKDRTGVFIMLLLGLCGVDDAIIAREYALSNLGYWGTLMRKEERGRERRVTITIADDPFLAESETELENKAKLLGVTVDDMRMVMSAP